MPFSATRDLWLVLKARDEASRAMSSFSRDIRMVGDSVRLANLQASRSALQNQMAVQRLTGASKNDILTTQNRIAAIDQEIGSMKVARAAMEEQRVSAQRLSSVLQGTAGFATAVGTGLVAAGVFGAMGLKSLVNAAVEYQKASALTSTQVDKFATSIQDVEKIGLRVATSIGVPFEQIQPALFDIFSSMEVGAQDAEKLLVIFSKAAVAGQTDIQSASKATIGILNAFHLPLSDVNHLMDVQFQLVKEGVGTYDEWAQRIGLVTPSAARAGQSVEMMAAALAASTRMGISAARSGTAVARAMDAMSNPAAVNALKALGVNAVDATGNFRPMLDTLFDFRKAIQNLPEADKVAKILDVFKGAGGTVEARRFLQNMLITPGNLELFQQIFQTMSTESGSFEQAYATMADTTATKSQLLANKWEAVKIAAGEALIPTFLKVIDVFSKIFDWFNKLSPATQKTVMTVLAFAAGASIVFGILLLLVGTIAAFAAAVAVAGSGLFVVIGIFAAIGIAFAAFVIALTIAWKKSEQFRHILGEVADAGRHLWQDVIIPFAKEVKSAFDQNLLPALMKFRDVLSNDVMPVVDALIKRFTGDFLSSAKQVANFVKEGLVVAFKAIGWVINTLVIPFIQMLVKYYHEHKETVDMVIDGLVWLAKWFAIIAAVITGVLLVAFAGPIVAIIIAFVLALTGIVLTIVQVVDAIRHVIDWFKHFGEHMDWVGNKTNSIWTSVKDFFVGIWNDIVNLVKKRWQEVVDAFNAVGAIIAGIWADLWNSKIGKLVQAAIAFVQSVIQLGLTVIQLAWAWTTKLIVDGWNMAWSAVVETVQAVWNFIGPYLIGAWDAISSVATKTGTAIANAWDFVWGFVKQSAINWWNAIVAYLKMKWDGIVSDAQIIWNTLTSAISTVWNNIVNAIKGKIQEIKDFFSGSGNWLYDAGKNIVGGLIDGMTSMFDKATEKVHQLVDKLKGLFPHSPAKWGPLSGRGGMFYAGQNMIKQLQDGISSKVNLVTSGASLMANAAGSSVTGISSGSSRSYNQNITVNTQELNPTRQAAELGWMLARSG